MVLMHFDETMSFFDRLDPTGFFNTEPLMGFPRHQEF